MTSRSIPTALTRAFIGALLVTALCGSCVSKKLYDEQVELTNRYARTLRDLEATQPELEARNAALTEELALLQQSGTVPAGFSRDIDERLAELDAMLAGLGHSAGEVTLFEVEGGFGYALPDAIVFGLGSTEISSEGRELLKGMAVEIARHDYRRLWVRGHSDDTPIVRPETAARFPHGNLQLSAERAVAVAAILAAMEEIDEGKLAISGFGPNEPLVPNSSTENRAKNRRVEILVLE